MSRTSPPVLTSLLLLLLLLLLLGGFAAAAEEVQLKSCKTLDEVLLEKYVTRQKRSSSVSQNAAASPAMPSGAADSNWLALYLLLQDRAEQLCDKTLYKLLNGRFDSAADADHVLAIDDNRQDNAITRTAVPQTGSEDQQANNVTLSSTAQKGSTWINASVTTSTTIAYNNDESSEKFSGTSSSETAEGSTTSYYDSSSSSSTLPGNFNQTFTVGDNEASGSNSNETVGGRGDNEDESARNEAVHALSKEEFRASIYRDKVDKDDKFVKDFFASGDKIIDGNEGWTSHSTEIDNGSDGNSSVDERDQLVDDFFANESENSSARTLDDDSRYNETASERDEFVDDFFANENESLFSNETTTSGSSSETVSEHDKLVDDFFANENENLFSSETAKTLDDDSSFNETVGEHDKLVDEFFANEDEDDIVNTTEAVSLESSMNAEDEFVRDFFANGYHSESGMKRGGHSKKMLDESQNNNSRKRDEIVDAFFASENENLTRSNGIESDGPSKDAGGAALYDKANNNKTASRGFNSTKSHDVVVSPSEVTPSTVLFVSEFENPTNGKELTAISEELSPTKSSAGLSDEAANVTSSELAEVLAFFNNSSGNSSSEWENSTDSSELISSREFVEAAIEESEEKNATTTAQTYSNETASAANGTEDRSTKYPDTGDRYKAGHTTPPSDDDLFKETTGATTMTSSDDWSSTIASIESPADEVSGAAAAAVRRRRRNILMTFRDDGSSAAASAVAASAGKLRAPEATSPRLVDDSDDDAWESSSSSESLNTRASSRNRPPRIIAVEMNKASGQYRTFLLGLQQSRQTQFAEKKEG